MNKYTYAASCIKCGYVAEYDKNEHEWIGIDTEYCCDKQEKVFLYGAGNVGQAVIALQSEVVPIVEEYLLRTCDRCGYEWREECVDAPKYSHDDDPPCPHTMGQDHKDASCSAT